MRRVPSFLTIVLLALTAVSGVAAPQHSKGNSTISGVVLGPDDRPVPRARVSYQSSDGRFPHAVRADSQGHFIITKLRADIYDLRASGKGVFSDWERNVTVRPGQTKSVTLRLIYAKEMPKAYVNTKPKQ